VCSVGRAATGSTQCLARQGPRERRMPPFPDVHARNWRIKVQQPCVPTATSLAGGFHGAPLAYSRTPMRWRHACRWPWAGAFSESNSMEASSKTPQIGYQPTRTLAQAKAPAKFTMNSAACAQAPTPARRATTTSSAGHRPPRRHARPRHPPHSDNLSSRRRPAPGLPFAQPWARTLCQQSAGRRRGRAPATSGQPLPAISNPTRCPSCS